MSVFITEKHLVAGEERKTYSDNKQLGFALRTTPNAVFTFYYQHLNKKPGKRDWHLIGSHPEWTPDRARTEATRLAGLVAAGNAVPIKVGRDGARRFACGEFPEDAADNHGLCIIHLAFASNRARRLPGKG